MTAAMTAPISDDMQVVYDTALAFSRKAFGPLVVDMDAKDYWPDSIWPDLAQAGYLGIGIPEEYGGSGGDYAMGAMVCQALSRVCPAIALSYGAHLNLCAHNLLRNGTEEQKRRWLPDLASGKKIGALGITEPNAGSDAMGIQLTARPDGDGYRLNGAKMFVTNGPNADFMIVYTKTAPELGSRGITAFCLEVPTDGYHVSRKLDKLGMRGSPTGEVTFHDVYVPASQIVGQLNLGYKVVMSGLDLERTFYSFLAVGASEECLDLALAYSQQREQFGAPIATFQLTQAKLADMYVGVFTSRMAALEALRLAMAGVRASKEAAASLLYASETSQRIANDALQVFGGYGYCKDFPIERFWRDGRLGTIGAGTSEIRRLLIARELLGQRG